MADSSIWTTVKKVSGTGGFRQRGATVDRHGEGLHVDDHAYMFSAGGEEIVIEGSADELLRWAWSVLSGAVAIVNRERVDADGTRVAALRGNVIDTPDGVRYEPWTDGHSVGFKAVHAKSGAYEIVHLCPSASTDDGRPNVFLYLNDDALSHVTVHDGLFPEFDPPPGAGVCDRCREWDANPQVSKACPTCGQPWTRVRSQESPSG